MLITCGKRCDRNEGDRSSLTQRLSYRGPTGGPIAASTNPAALHDMALSFLEVAREEALSGYAAKDMRHVRDAAEKAWLAALQATDAAMARHGRVPEPGPRAHFTRQEFLEEVGRKDLGDKLRVFADKLHGQFFYYGGVPDEAGMAAALDEVEDFVRRLELEV